MGDRPRARSYHALSAVAEVIEDLAGQATFIANGQAASRYQTFIVPDGIYFISAVVVSYTSQMAPAGTNYSGYVECRIMRGGQNGTKVFGTSDAIGTNGVGGGNGGRRGYDGAGDGSNSSRHVSSNSGGGAGGYNGNGGSGGVGNFSGYSYTGQAGTGGGGGGGGGYMGNPPAHQGAVGGPVGLFGIGSNGIGGGPVYAPTSPTKGGIGSPLSGPYVGAGAQSSWGGDLRWKNNISVTPGEVLTIDLGTATRNAANYTGAGCRIIYGDTRTFPNDAQNSIPQGQVILTGNTTWTVPNGVTSICACAQQYSGSSDAITLTKAGSVVLSAVNGSRIAGTSGGYGGPPGQSVGTSNEYHGGGGCGGYDGDGGKGGDVVDSPTIPGQWEGQAGLYGTNTGGRGGDGSSRTKSTGPVFGGATSTFTITPANAGTSIGIKGRLPSGLYRDPVDGDAGGGPPGVRGGALAYINNLTVTPGEVLTIAAGNGRLRIIYGEARTYPTAAYDL